jgi:hypothetical protein
MSVNVVYLEDRGKNTHNTLLGQNFGVFSVKIVSPYIQLPLCFEEVKDNVEKTDRFYFTKMKGNKKERGYRGKGGEDKNGRTCSVIAVICSRNPPN